MFNTYVSVFVAVWVSLITFGLGMLFYHFAFCRKNNKKEISDIDIFQHIDRMELRMVSELLMLKKALTKEYHDAIDNR